MSSAALNAVLPGDGPEGLFREPGIWQSVWKLLRMRIVILISGFRRAKLRRKIGLIVLGLLLLTFLGFILFLSILLLYFLRSPALAQYVGDTGPFLETFPILMVSGATGGILLTSFSVLLQALYLSGDMDFLMSAPIPVRAIFITKLLEALMPNFSIMCLFALPVLFGLGSSGGYNLLYYPMVLVVLAALTAAAAGVAALLVMSAVRIFPARRIAEVMGFVVGTFFFISSQTTRFMNFRAVGNQVPSLMALTQRFNQPWSPLAWAGQGLVHLGKGEWLPALGLLGLALVLTGGVFYVSLLSAERLYYTGWSSLQNNRRRSKPAPVKPVVGLPAAGAAEAATVTARFPFERLLPRAVRAIVVKDFTLYRRDLRSISKLITPLILGVVYAISLVQAGPRGPSDISDAPLWVAQTLRGVLLYGDVILALFVGWMLAANLAGLGVSLEGKNYWMLKMAPVSARQFLAAKYLVAYLPSLTVCSVYVFVLELLKGAGLWSMLVSLLATALLLAGVNGIYLAFGVVGAKFDWENPNQMGRTVGCLGSLAGMAYLPVCFSLFIGPALLTGILGLPAPLGQSIGLVLGGAAGIAAAVIPLMLVEKRVATLNEA